MEYWYCLEHDRVEKQGETCPTSNQLGPYATRGEATRALQKVEERNEDWDEDPAWNDDEDGDWSS